MAELIDILPKAASRAGDIAYYEAVTEASTGAVASLILDALDIDVGLCYKKVDVNTLNISLRGRRGLRLHLGELTQSIAKKNGGSGGGHGQASGAILPARSLTSFILDFEKELERAKIPHAS